MALKTGMPIPPSWALDINGQPTVDPAEGIRGSVRPIADYKGSGIAMIVGFLCSMLSHGAVGPILKNVYNDFDGGLNKGQLFMAVDIAHMTNPALFRKEMDLQVDFIKSSTPVSGTDEVYMPGEIAYRMYERQYEQGIVYAQEILKELAEISQNLGIPVPEGIC